MGLVRIVVAPRVAVFHGLQLSRDRRRTRRRLKDAVRSLKRYSATVPTTGSFGDSGRRIALSGLENGVGRQLRKSASKQLGICARGAQLEGMECSRRTAAVVRGKEKRPSLVLQFAPRPRCRQRAHKYRTQDLRKEAPATHTHVAWPEPDCTYYCTGGVCRIPAAHSIATRTTMAAKAPPVQYAVFLVSGVMVESST